MNEQLDAYSEMVRIPELILLYCVFGVIGKEPTQEEDSDVI